MFVIIQPIFIPNDDFLKKHLNSIRSLKNYLKNYPFEIFMITGGWCDVKYWNDVLIELEEIKHVLTKFEYNFGKAYVVNALYDLHVVNMPIDHFFTYDTDMIFDTCCENMFVKLLSLASVIETEYDKSIGMLALDQHQNCCHDLKEYDVVEFLNLTLQIPKNSYGVAGGAMLVSKKAWNDVKGYRILNIYGGNDGWYLNDCFEKYFIAIVKDLYMIHPFENDERYVLWKRNQMLMLNDVISFEELKNRAVLHCI